ncbi:MULTISPECIES: LCP family protein [Dactylosporangium]|uniref:Transcriptional regulator n=2 Tax=Dactylosporangium TaxID=35753 RepID=A0A9W6NNW8_9ACTN|nr:MULTISPECIES: LCP family protein [Dactylosporangium]UAB94241.1 LCP family protein [Dactylosporangium vinaceum]UWZ42644.1 LCP family protein [Dactylosporangium matsuzakiense]GLL03884.1 transcriptional regulator [Dactylosporangium matsuzakiense]
MKAWLVAAAVVVAVALGGTATWQHYVGSVENADLLGDAGRDRAGSPRQIDIQSAPRLSGGPGGGPSADVQQQLDSEPGRNILLVGLDARPEEDRAAARADTVIVVHVTEGGDRAFLVSLPRDTRVAIPGHGTDKLNAAYAFGGFELLARTVQQITGLVFDAGAIIDFAGLRKVVDAVGGVELCVDEETTSVHIGWDAAGRETPPYRLIPPSFRPERIAGVRPQVYHVGCRHFAGWEALDYVRQRELIPDGDYGRQRHQQQLLRALAEKVTSAGVLANPLALNRVVTAVGDSLTFDGNGSSVTDWIVRLRAIGPSDLTLLRTNAGQFHTEQRDGRDYEHLDATTADLFTAARDDRLGEFAAAHPDWVI